MSKYLQAVEMLDLTQRLTEIEDKLLSVQISALESRVKNLEAIVQAMYAAQIAGKEDGNEAQVA